MAVLAPPDYPAILTDADWQKKKGIIAKMTGETGIGAQLKKIKTAFDNVDWPKFYAKLVCAKEKGVVTPTHATAAKAEMMKEHKNEVNKVREELIKFDTLGKKVAADFKKNKLIPKSSTEHVELMVKTAEAFKVALKDTGVYVTASIKEFDEEISRLERILEKAKQGIQDCLKNLLLDGAKVKSTPDVATFTGGAKDGFYQRIRGVNAALLSLKDYPELEKFRKETWIKFSQADYLPKSDDQVEEKLKSVLAAAKTLGQLIKDHL